MKKPYISDEEVDEILTDCVAPLSEENPPDYEHERLTEMCHYSDISSDDMDGDIHPDKGTLILENIQLNVKKCRQYLNESSVQVSSNEHINILPLRLLKEKTQHGCGDRA